MARPVLDLRWHATRDSDFQLPTQPVWAAGVAFGGPLGIDAERGDDLPEIVGEEAITFNTDEAAARFYLDQLFDRDERPGVRSLTAPERPQVVPDLRLVETHAIPTAGTRVLRFQQYERDIPVFGTRAVVELDNERKARSVGAELAEVGEAPPVATLSPRDAFARLAKALKLPPGDLVDVAPPTLTFFEDERRQEWHLAYLFTGVPGRAHPRARDHGMAPSPRSAEPRLNCLIQATGTGSLLFQYGADPSLADLPVQCHGLDELDQDVRFWGRSLGGSFLLDDPQRKAQTYDLQFADLVVAGTPQSAISSSTTDWGAAHRAAISAHYNAARVLDFFNTVLLRDGVDGRGMPLVSLVNCLYRPTGAGRLWANAVWYKNRMWYGQKKDPELGRFASYSRFLDVIAHELTHGVTQNTSNLVYEGESGALNESISDIFGVIISNWDRHSDDGGSVDGWVWQIGRGLAAGGGPLRDLKDPTATGMPDHMSKYLTTTGDFGGVHTNSNIHNKAAYNVLTATDAAGARIFTPFDVATLYYWVLERLNDRATFVKTLQALIDVVSSVHAGDEAVRTRMVGGIERAYAAVGIQE
jgi:Zn-dependent metalloprotease